jgi:hypothetical protein
MIFRIETAPGGSGRQRLSASPLATGIITMLR